jgi:hypothetical protein
MTNRDALWVNDKGQTVPVIVDEAGNRVSPLPTDPFAGKGDHDNNGTVGGAHAPIPEPAVEREPEAKPKRHVKTRT